MKNLLMKIKKDMHFRVKLFLCLSLAFNFAYSIFLFVASRIYNSKWFLVISIYYALLFVIREVIFYQLIKGNKANDVKTVRFCGVFLLVINLVVSAMHSILIFDKSAVSYHEIIVITLATYTFSTLTIAIISLVKRLKNKAIIYSSISAISLVSSAVSLSTLTNTMLATFGEDNLMLRSVILPILSLAVSLFIVALAIIMIKSKNKEIIK